jgi:hypothetical protein
VEETVSEGTKSRVRLLPLFLALFAALALFWQPGMLIQDEVAQAAGLASLADGHYWVGNLPSPYGGSVFQHWGVPHGSQHLAPIGSSLLDVVALPFFLLLHALAGNGSIWPALALVQGIVVGCGAWGACTLVPRWRQLARQLGLLAGALAVAAGVVRDPVVSAHPYLEFAALELVNMAAAAAGAVLIFDLVRRTFGPRTAVASMLLYLFATPAYFWSHSNKYHALGMLLTVAAAWAYRDGFRTPPRRTAVAALFAGLAIWNFLPFGLLLLATLVLLALPAVRLGWRGCASRWGAGVAVLTLGAIPIVLERSILGHSGLADQFLPQLQPGGGLDWSGLSYLFDPNSPTGWLAHTVFTDPAGVASSAWATLFWPDLHRAPFALGFVSTAPWLAVVALVVARRAWRSRIPRPWLWWAAVSSLLLFFVMGILLEAPGGVFDMRYAANLWPFAVLLAAPGIDALLIFRPWPWWLAAVSYTTAFILATAILVLFLGHAAAGHNLFSPGFYLEGTATFRWGGLALAVLCAAAAWRHPAAMSWRAWTMAAAAGAALALQLFLALSIGKWESPPDLWAPFVSAPVQWLHDCLMWMLYGFM